MKRLFVLGPILFTLVGSGCATRGYARRQAATVNDRVSQIQTQHQNQFTSLSDKHQTDVSRVDERITTTDIKAQQAITTAAQANVNAAQASASAAQANASAAQAKQR